MHFHLDSAEIFVPDGLEIQPALVRTTHLAVSAHQDDIDIMAAAPILECFQRADRWFTGVVVTDGRGMAAGVTMTVIPIIIFFVLLQRHFVRGLTGAVKG